jgi:hypothetical protein
MPRGFIARIVRWPAIKAIGNSPEDAAEKLLEKFCRSRYFQESEGQSMLRPGMEASMDRPSSNRTNAHPELRDDFIGCGLGLKWALLSDDSSLWNFHCRESNDALYEKIVECYGVEVSDIKSGNISAIIGRIAQHQD